MAGEQEAQKTPAEIKREHRMYKIREMREQAARLQEHTSSVREEAERLQKDLRDLRQSNS